MIWIPFFIGLFIGCFLGIMVLGLCVMAKSAQDESDRGQNDTINP